MLTKEQVEERTAYIGSSDAAAVLGMSRWSTPIRVWAEKTGQLPVEDISNHLAVEVGNELEELVCKLFTKRTGKEVRRVNETLIHPKYPFIRTNIDRRVVAEDAVLEAKTASAWKAKEWSGEDIPQEYIIQVFHQLAVTGKEKGYIAVLIGGNMDFVWKEIHRDEKIIADIVRREVAFWNDFVVPKKMPLQVTRNDADTLFGLFPEGGEEEEIELGDEANALADELEAMGKDAYALEGQIEKTRNALRVLLKDHAVGKTDRWRITWKNQSRTGLDTKKLKKEKPEVCARFSTTTKSRVLRISSLVTEPKSE
jgi:putative phage-type endonuclease